MTVSPFALLLLLGSLQGVILAFLLWFDPKGERLPNRLLAALMAILASACFCVGVPLNNPWVSLLIDFLPWIVVMPIGPLLFFYTKTLLDPGFRMGRRQRLHFLPAILDAGSQLLLWTYVIGLLLGVFSYEDRQWWGGLKDAYDIYSDVPRWLSLTVYLWLAQRLINRQKRQYGLTALQQHHVGWLQPLLRVWVGFQVVWLLYLIPYEIPASRDWLMGNIGWYPIYIPLAMLIYWVGLRGYLHSSRTVVSKERKIAPTALPSEIVQSTSLALRLAMENDCLYLMADLTVEKLGRHLDLPPKTISAVLNQHLQKSFNEFVNEYRVEEVKKRLREPAHQHLTISGIALDSGFNSQATFQRTFKQITGVSPRQFLAGQLTD